MSENGSRATRSQVLDEIRAADRFILVTHENPDGDALGSLVAMHEILGRLGKDTLMFMAADEFPLPHEYRFFRLDGCTETDRCRSAILTNFQGDKAQQARWNPIFCGRYDRQCLLFNTLLILAIFRRGLEVDGALLGGQPQTKFREL